MAGEAAEHGRFDIRRVPVTEVIGLRHAILRAGLPIETARFDGDEEPDTAHFAAFADGQAIGCATVLQRPWQNAPAWQVRGMAVLEGRRRGGVGRGLLMAIEDHVRARAATMLWCNARTPAAGFYEKLGWRKASEEFEIPTAGPHFKMTKALGLRGASHCSE
jgi:GNAT superfamily N-acetyltransferase